MTNGAPGAGPPGIEVDARMVEDGIRALRELSSDPEKARDGARVYDFGIRWGVLMAGRLKRLEHYRRAGELTGEQARRYAEIRHGLEDAAPLIERLGLARPDVPPQAR